MSNRQTKTAYEFTNYKPISVHKKVYDELTDENFWLSEIEHNHGSGYELHPEIVLRGDL